MRRNDPAAYVRVVANILPKLEVDVKHTVSRIEQVIVDRVIEHEPTQHARDIVNVWRHQRPRLAPTGQPAVRLWRRFYIQGALRGKPRIMWP
jgi:hypothetical protein